MSSLTLGMKARAPRDLPDQLRYSADMKEQLLEERGYFWWHSKAIRPGHFAPANALTGVLRIDAEGGIELELDGVMPGAKNHRLPLFFGNESPDLGERSIQGILKSSNRHVLLIGLYHPGGRFATNGISFEKYRATNCLVGHGKFSRRKNALLFKTIEISLAGYEDWLRLNNIYSEHTGQRLTITYEQIPDKHYPQPDGDLVLQFDLRGPWHGKQRNHELALDEKAALIYNFTNAVTVEQVKQKHRLFEDLFILLADSSYGLDWPILSVNRDRTDRYTLYFNRTKRSTEVPDWYKCWTNFMQIGDSFGSIFQAWTQKREEFGPGFYLYLGTRRGIPLYIEHRFVNLVWGIESFHRKGDDGGRALNSKTSERIGRVLAAVTSGKDRKWLKGKLAHADEPTLEQRIFDTFKPLPLGIAPARMRTFAIACALRRNEISHFGGVRSGDDYDEFLKKVNILSDALSYLYHCLLLREIGVDANLLTQFVSKGFRSGEIQRAFVGAGLLAELPARQKPTPDKGAI